MAKMKTKCRMKSKGSIRKYQCCPSRDSSHSCYLLSCWAKAFVCAR